MRGRSSKKRKRDKERGKAWEKEKGFNDGQATGERAQKTMDRRGGGGGRHIGTGTTFKRRELNSIHFQSGR